MTHSHPGEGHGGVGVRAEVGFEVEEGGYDVFAVGEDGELEGREACFGGVCGDDDGLPAFVVFREFGVGGQVGGGSVGGVMRTFMSSPSSMRVLMMPARSARTARCRSVRPFSSVQWMSAPAWIRVRIFSVSLHMAAYSRGVRLRRSFASRSMPAMLTRPERSLFSNIALPIAARCSSVAESSKVALLPCIDSGDAWKWARKPRNKTEQGQTSIHTPSSAAVFCAFELDARFLTSAPF